MSKINKGQFNACFRQYEEVISASKKRVVREPSKNMIRDGMIRRRVDDAIADKGLRLEIGGLL